MAIKKTTNPASAGIKYEVLEECGCLGVRTSRNGEERVLLRYMSWNDGDPRYDIRAWFKTDEGTERCGKGITLSGEELIELGNIIAKLQEE